MYKYFEDIINTKVKLCVYTYYIVGLLVTVQTTVQLTYSIDLLLVQFVLFMCSFIITSANVLSYLWLTASDYTVTYICNLQLHVVEGGHYMVE